jgi:hypothetical protein
MRQFVIPALLAIAASPALAGTWTEPAGCEVYVTVQSKACRVSHHYHCSADTPGDQWRVDMDQEGTFFFSRIDREGQWVESLGATRQTLDPFPADPASISALLAQGIDTADFFVTNDDGSSSRYSGFDRLTGSEMVIDGVTLLQTEIDFTEYTADGTVLGRARGREYIHPDWRTFFAGPGERDLGDGQWLPIDGSPVDFIFSGEPGFLSTQPIYDCDVLSAGLEFQRVSHEP